MVGGLSLKQRGLGSAWIVHNSGTMIREDHVQALLNGKIAVPSLSQRALSGLRFIASRFPEGKFFSGGEILPAGDTAFLPATWSNNSGESEFVLKQLLLDELGWVKQVGAGHLFSVSAKGWLALEGQPNAQSSIGFVAMWFSDEVRELFNKVIDPAIRDAGYEPLRIDSKEHNNKIDDEIVASIRSARFVVADYTGDRGGVYYEAGFAHGLGLPVVFMAKEGTTIHFDTRQYNTIFWKAEDLADARERLKNRILATLGRSPKASN